MTNDAALPKRAVHTMGFREQREVEAAAILSIGHIREAVQARRKAELSKLTKKLDAQA